MHTEGAEDVHLEGCVWVCVYMYIRRGGKVSPRVSLLVCLCVPCVWVRIDIFFVCTLGRTRRAFLISRITSGRVSKSCLGWLVGCG